MSPVFSSAKHPVPYVDFIMPGWKQAWPMVAACWSPATPKIGTGLPSTSVTPKSAALSCTVGSIDMGRLSSAQMSASHAPR